MAASAVSLETMTVIVAKEDADKAIAALDCSAYVIGEIVSGDERVTLC